MPPRLHSAQWARGVLEKYRTTNPAPPKLVVYSEGGTDPDEVQALVLLCTLIMLGQVELLAVIGNHFEAIYRARLAKWVLSSLGHPYTPVGWGEEIQSASTKFVERDPQFLGHSGGIENGRELLRRTLRNLTGKEQVILVLNSGFTDALWLLMDDPRLFKQRVAHVVIMGGVMVQDGRVWRDEGGFIVPNVTPGKGPANNLFDSGSTLHIYRTLQEMDVPTTTLTREAAYACMIPFSLYGEMESIGQEVGVRLAWAQRRSINERWHASVACTGRPPKLGEPHRDISWFVKVFCRGIPPRDIPNDIFPHLQQVGGMYALYDALNVVAAVPALAERFFKPTVARHGRTRHQIIGVSARNHGVKDPAGLYDLLTASIIHSLTWASMNRGRAFRTA